MKSKTINYQDSQYPQNLLQIKDRPKNLYYLGNTKILNDRKVVAIVGSRDCTEYGRKYARIFATELSQNGICVISGLAKGIDSAAHFGAMCDKGKTIAVLGGGINNIYPKENEWLFKEILANGGCVITEHEDNAETVLSGFPKRNRIISGIADGVLIIEAKKRSGSAVTAKYAKQQRKKIYCIPSNLDSKNGSGTNELLREGAKFVTDPSQIVRDLYNMNEVQEYEQQSIIQVSDEYTEIYELVKEREMSKDEIARKLNKNISEVNSILTMMEIEGYVEQIAGNAFKLRKN